MISGKVKLLSVMSVCVLAACGGSTEPAGAPAIPPTIAPPASAPPVPPPPASAPPVPPPPASAPPVPPPPASAPPAPPPPASAPPTASPPASPVPPDLKRVSLTLPATRVAVVTDGQSAAAMTWKVISAPGFISFSPGAGSVTVLTAARPGTYVLEASGSSSAGSIATFLFELKVEPTQFSLTPATTTEEVLRSSVKPNFKAGHRLPPIASSSISTHPAILKELAESWGWGLQTNMNSSFCTPDPTNATGAPFYSGAHNDEVIRLAVNSGGKHRLVLSSANLLPKGNGKFFATPGLDINDQPSARGLFAAQWNYTTPESVWYNDGKGNGIGSRIGFNGQPGADASANPRFSPMAPIDWVRARIRETAQCAAKFSKIYPVALIADYAEYGFGLFGSDYCMALNDPALLSAVGYSNSPDKSCYGTIAGQPESRIDKRDEKIARLLSSQYIRNYKATRDEYAQATRNAGGSGALFSVYGNAYGSDRGRWNGWVNFNPRLEDEGADKISFASGVEHYYTDFNSGFEGVDPSAQCAPTDILFKALNNIGGSIANGQKNMYPWISAGYKETALDKTLIADRERWMGFMKMMFIGGALGAMPGYFNYGFEDYENRQFRNSALGGKIPNWLWPIIDLGHVQATFSHFEQYLRDGDLVPGATSYGATTHPYSVDTAPIAFFALRLKGAEFTRPSCFNTDRNYAPTAYVMARKLPNQEKYLVGAWANVGPERNVTAMIPGKGEITLRARPAGSVYMAERNANGGWVIQLKDPEAMLPSTFLY
jgi:hypothetical protein